MSAGLRRTLPYILAFASFFCMAQGLMYAESGSGKANVRVLQMEEAYDGKSAAAVLENARAEGTESEEELMFTFWGEQTAVPVYSPEMDRSAEAAMVSVCGNSRLVLESSRTIGTQGVGETENSYGIHGENLCLISESLGLALFGDEAVSGHKLKLEGKEYETVGTLECDTPSVLVLADDTWEAMLDKIALAVQEGKSAQETIRRFESKTGISGKIVPIHFYRMGAAFVSRLLLGIIYFFLWLQLFQKLRRYDSWTGFCKCFFITIASAVLGIWVLGISITIPREMLPTMWSDFGFWSELWKQKTEQLSTLLRIEKSLPGLLLFRGFMKTAGCSIAAAVFGFFSFGRLQMKEELSLAVLLVCSVFAAFLFLVMNRPNSALLLEEKIIWLFLPLCFVMRYLCTRPSLENTGICKAGPGK